MRYNINNTESTEPEDNKPDFPADSASIFNAYTISMLLAFYCYFKFFFIKYL